ncbi:hypothetical protein HDU93_005912, partial [Gonapodya sp. JEL0774]
MRIALENGSGSNGTQPTPSAKSSTQMRLDSVFTYHDTLEFQTEVFPTDKEGFKAVQRTISQYQDERHGPTVILVQSQRS